MKIIFFLFFSMLQLSIFACSCVFQPLDVKKILQYDLVFKGKVIAKEKVKIEVDSTSPERFFDRGRHQYQYTFEIKTAYKSEEQPSQVQIYSHTQGAACGVNYSIGEEFIIFAYAYNGRYSTDLCAGNIRKKDWNKADKKILCDYKTSKDVKNWKDKMGKVIAKGAVYSEQAEGAWQFFSAEGWLESEGQYLEGKKDGIWKYYKNQKSAEQFYDQLTSAQQQQVTDPHHIFFRMEEYQNGKRIKSEYIFKD